jgi:hypothetical protein
MNTLQAVLDLISESLLVEVAPSRICRECHLFKRSVDDDGCHVTGRFIGEEDIECDEPSRYWIYDSELCFLVKRLVHKLDGRSCTSI